MIPLVLTSANNTAIAASSTFYGNGINGSLTVSSSITISGNIFNYTNVTVQSGASVHFSSTSSTVYVADNLVIHGTLYLNNGQHLYAASISGDGQIAGVPAGTVYIIAYNINFTGTVQANGANGAAGSTGSQGKGGAAIFCVVNKNYDGCLAGNGTTGGNGGNGGAGGNGGVIYLNVSYGYISQLQAKGGNGGAGGIGGNGGGGGACVMLWNNASYIGANCAGGAGGSGGNAGNGGNGGNGGSIYIYNATKFTATVSVAGGLGGNRELGGAGGGGGAVLGIGSGNGTAQPGQNSQGGSVAGNGGGVTSITDTTCGESSISGGAGANAYGQNGQSGTLLNCPDVVQQVATSAGPGGPGGLAGSAGSSGSPGTITYGYPSPAPPKPVSITAKFTGFDSNQNPHFNITVYDLINNKLSYNTQQNLFSITVIPSIPVSSQLNWQYASLTFGGAQTYVAASSNASINAVATATNIMNVSLTGAALVYITSPLKPSYIQVNSANYTNWLYDSTNKQIIINDTLGSKIGIIYPSSSSGSGSPSPPGAGGIYIPPQPQTMNQPTPTQLSGLAYIGLFVIIIIILVSIISSIVERRRNPWRIPKAPKVKW